jgi:hypothetical protein
MDKDEYLALILPAAQLAEEKSADYNGEESLHDYFPFGAASYVQMIHVKSKRLVALTNKEEEPSFESKRDTVLDLINYCVFYLDYIENIDVEE